MTQSQLNHAVSKATGDDCDIIESRGFSLISEEAPVQEDDFLALLTAWQQVEAESEAATRRQTAFASVA